MTRNDHSDAEYERAYAAHLRGEYVGHTRIGNWCVMAHRLLSAARELGRLPTPADDVTASLIHWVTYQRRPRAQHTGFQVRFLESVPGWSWDPYADVWERRLRELQAFIEGHGREPRFRATDRDERVLAKWAARQRQLHVRGELPYLRVQQFRPYLSERD